MCCAGTHLVDSRASLETETDKYADRDADAYMDKYADSDVLAFDTCA